MQVSRESEYAIKLLCFLKRQDAPAAVAALAELMQVALQDVEQIVGVLCDNLVLVRDDDFDTIDFLCDPGELTLLGVISVMEGSAKLTAAAEDEDTPADDVEYELRRLHRYVRKGIERCYGEVTISDVVSRADARTRQAEKKRLAAEAKKPARQTKRGRE